MPLGWDRAGTPPPRPVGTGGTHWLWGSLGTNNSWGTAGPHLNTSPPMCQRPPGSHGAQGTVPGSLTKPWGNSARHCHAILGQNEPNSHSPRPIAAPPTLSLKPVQEQLLDTILWHSQRLQKHIKIKEAGLPCWPGRGEADSPCPLSVSGLGQLSHRERSQRHRGSSRRGANPLALACCPAPRCTPEPENRVKPKPCQAGRGGQGPGHQAWHGAQGQQLALPDTLNTGGTTPQGKGQALLTPSAAQCSCLGTHHGETQRTSAHSWEQDRETPGQGSP